MHHGEVLTLPSITSETLEARLRAWSPDVPDPTALAWRALCSATHQRELGDGPAQSDPGWVVTTCVNRGTVDTPDYRVLIPVSGKQPGLHGLWVRVAGGALSSPARWVGSVRLI